MSSIRQIQIYGYMCVPRKPLMDPRSITHTYHYADDILCTHDDPDSIHAHIDKCFLLKPVSVGEPNVYLGAKLKLV